MASISHFFSLSLSLSLSLSFSLPLQLNYALHQVINAHTHSHHSLAIHYSFIQLLTEVFHTRVPCIKQLRKATSTSLSSCLSSSLSLSFFLLCLPFLVPFGKRLKCPCRVHACHFDHFADLINYPLLLCATPLPDTFLHSLRAHYDVMCSIIFIFYSYLHFTAPPKR